MPVRCIGRCREYVPEGLKWVFQLNFGVFYVGAHGCKSHSGAFCDINDFGVDCSVTEVTTPSQAHSINTNFQIGAEVGGGLADRCDIPCVGPGDHLQE